MYFETASRGKQMVSKEGFKNLHQFLGLNLCFWGDPILAPQIHGNLFQNGRRNGPHRFPGAVSRTHFLGHIL